MTKDDDPIKDDGPIRGRCPQIYTPMPEERVLNCVVNNVKKNEVIVINKIAGDINIDRKTVQYHLKKNINQTLEDGSKIIEKTRSVTKISREYIKDPPDHPIEIIDEKLDEIRTPPLQIAQFIDENFRTSIKPPYRLSCRCGFQGPCFPIVHAFLPSNLKIPCPICGHIGIFKCNCGRLVETAHLSFGSPVFCAGCGKEYNSEGESL